MLINESNNRYRLKTYSKEIFYFFKNYLEYVPQIKHSTVKLKPISFSTIFKIGFLRGLIDIDGYIKINPDKSAGKITFCTTSEKLAVQIKNILSELDIKSGLYTQIREYRNEKPVYYVNIWKESANRFINIIKPLKFGLRRAGS